MSRIAYVNGRYLPHRAAAVHIEDRALQFGDGVYEVCEIRSGALIDEARHMARLQRSLSELRIAEPMDLAALGVILREVVRRNQVRNGIVYLQVTRGAAARNHAFPPAGTRPGLIVTARSINPADGERLAAEGVAVITTRDNRWERVDIKSIGLLPNVMAKQQAKDAGAYEAWFVDDDGFVTEGSSTNAWIVTRSGTLVTRPAENGILRGITRGVMLESAEKEGLSVEERRFTVDEALDAAEAFVTGSSMVLMPVVSVDRSPIGDGNPGPVARRLRAIFHSHAISGPKWSSGRSRTGEN